MSTIDEIILEDLLNSLGVIIDTQELQTLENDYENTLS